MKPLDEETILASASKTGHVVTCEEHSVYGGVGSAIAELLGEKLPVPCHRVGMNYASCSPFRVPIARLAAAQAAIEEKASRKK